MARATTRRRELGVRCALGATRGQLVRLLLVESLLLAGSSALLGLVFARWGAQIVVNQFSTPFVHVALDIAPDLRVLAFTIGASAATVLLFGVAPAFSASRVDPIEALRWTVRTTAGEPSRRVAAALVAGQVMLSLVVISAAALLAHSFVNVMRLRPGFDVDHVLLVTVSTLHSEVSPARRFNVLSEIVEAIRAIPNVTGAGASTITPGSGVAVVDFVSRSAAEHLSESERVVTTNVITPGWIATYRISLRAGRDFEAADMNNGRLVMLVNEAFVRRFLRENRAVGETIRFQAGPSRTVVGVVSDAIYNSVKEPIPPTVYVPLGVTPPTMTVSVRVGSRRPTDIAAAIRNAIERHYPDAAFSFRTLTDQVNSSTAQDRLVALLAVAFSVLALALAALGIYGVTAYTVARRRAEIGVRMALGAKPSGIIRMVLGRVWQVIGAGVVMGVAVNLWAATVVRSLLYGVDARDPATLIGAAGVLVAVATLAGLLPAWRASQIDPAKVLRES
jgi:predicted permease